jgi:transposase InsO family protein
VKTSGHCGVCRFTTLEVFVAHRNARLTVHGRRLLVYRVLELGMPVAHVAKAMGVSRQCAHRWVSRFDAEGDSGLHDRSSRPHSMPARTPEVVEQRVVAARLEHRRGQDWLAGELGLAARTISRILRRHDLPRLCTLDPLTGEVIRSSKMTARRYERSRPGELVHMDVKKIGRIPDGGGWRSRGRQAANQNRGPRVGYDYVHSLVDDHSRLAYSEIHHDERADTCAEFFCRALDYFADLGIHRVQRLITDNAFSYRNGRQLRHLLTARGIQHKFIKPHCPWQNGKAERFNRTLQTEWAYQQVFTSNADRSAALAPWLDYYNHRRRHSAIADLPPISRLSPT